jgi:hypothetical protein
MKKIIKIIIVSFIIYTFFFCNIGNTCYRINSKGIKTLNILPLFTEGFIGPFRTLFIILSQEGLWKAIKYFQYEAYNLTNPISTFMFIYGIHNVLHQNKIL